jgi:hypothetical protein
MNLNFDSEREQLQAKRTELLAGVAVIDDALKVLAQGAAGSNGATAAVGIRAGRKPMSAKAKRAASLRMKAYWANRRKAERVKTR